HGRRAWLNGEQKAKHGGGSTDISISADNSNVLKRLKAARWSQLSRGDQVALLLAETGVIAACLWLLSASEFTRPEWQAALLLFGLLFVFVQGIVILTVAIFASRRRTWLPMP